jgi:hypothetical protein
LLGTKVFVFAQSPCPSVDKCTGIVDEKGWELAIAVIGKVAAGLVELDSS